MTEQDQADAVIESLPKGVIYRVRSQSARTRRISSGYGTMGLRGISGRASLTRPRERPGPRGSGGSSTGGTSRPFVPWCR